MTSTLFESFMVFYLLEVIVLAFIAFDLIKKGKKTEEEISGEGSFSPNGPSPSDMIKMRAIAKEMQRQNK